MRQAPVILFMKAHVGGYTRKDGVSVKAHEDRRRSAHKPGDNVMFPHPKKTGKKALGKFVGERNGKSVVSHDEHGEMEFDHHDVVAARGVPKSKGREQVQRETDAAHDALASAAHEHDKANRYDAGR